MDAADERESVDKPDDKTEELATEERKAMLDELPEVSAPYLPPKAVGDPPYTLVLDLDETLIHFVCGNEDQEKEKLLEGLEEGENDFFYMVRPYCNKFLTELS